MAIDNHPAGTRETAAERRQQALELRKAGHSYRAIGAELGMSEAQAHRDVKAALTRLAQMELASADELRTMELTRLDTLAVEAMRVLLATHPLISGGKVLSGFTEEGTAIGLTDDGPKLAAIERLIRISESRRKLLGLDAPAKTALMNPDGSPLAAHYIELRTVLLQVVPPEHRPALAAALELLNDDQPADS